MSAPTAMEADKTKEEMTMATIIKQTKEEINWAEIARAREMGVLDKLLAERDVIRFHLRSGTEAAIMVEKVEPGRVWIGFVDGVAERPMYNRLERPVSWKESDARKWCNSDLVQDLPEDLVSIITPRTIRQTIKGEELVTTDLLWLHSATEFFGRKPWADGDDPTEEQLPVYKTERDRVKMWNGQTWPHYTRSAYAGYNGNFCLVDTDGTPNNLQRGLFKGAGPQLLDLIGGAYQRKFRPRKGRRKETDMAKRKEIKWRREGRGTMTGRQDGIIFRIFRLWDAQERGHTVSCYDTRGAGREISTAGYREFTWEEAVEFCQKIAGGEIGLEDLRAQFDAEDMAKEREAVRKTTEKAKRLTAMLEGYGMKYTDLLELEVMRHALGEMGHQILMGYHRGEGWPDGT